MTHPRRHAIGVAALATAALVLAVLLPGAAGSPLLAQTRATAGDSLTWYPLHPGDTWVYGRQGPFTHDTWTVRVGERFIAPDGRAYFEQTGYFFGPRGVRAQRNNVYEFDHGTGGDNLWYRLGAAVGASWILQLAPTPIAAPMVDCWSGSRLTVLDRNQTLTVPAGTFRGVVKVGWQSPCVDAGTVLEYFAPGVGLIRREDTSLAGAIVSELLRAEIDGVVHPAMPYATTIDLDRPVYVNNLMPPIGPEAIPTVRGFLVVANRTDLPVTFEFGGCKSVTVVVTDEAGRPLLTARGDDGGCCVCLNILPVVLQHDVLAIPFAFRLALEDGGPLPDGNYGVTATLNSLDGAPIRPSATARIEVRSTH